MRHSNYLFSGHLSRRYHRAFQHPQTLCGYFWQQPLKRGRKEKIEKQRCRPSDRRGLEGGQDAVSKPPLWGRGAGAACGKVYWALVPALPWIPLSLGLSVLLCEG